MKLKNLALPVLLLLLTTACTQKTAEITLDPIDEDTLGQEKSAEDSSIGSEVITPDQVEPEFTYTTTDEWRTYQNEQLDFTFDYPANWQLPQDWNHMEDNYFNLNFDASGLYLWIFGINDQFIPEGPMPNFELCATEHKSMDEFCEDGCEKITENTALKYQATRNGDAGYGLYVYTDISKKYPSTCIELDITQVLYEIAEEKGIKYYEVPPNYDVETMIENREVSESVLQAVDDFKHFVETIKSN